MSDYRAESRTEKAEIPLGESQEIFVQNYPSYRYRIELGGKGYTSHIHD